MLYPQLNELLALKSKCKAPVLRAAKTSVTGNHHSPFRGQGLEFDAVREYVPGDDIRAIDWRVTARTGAPHIKIFKEEKERPLILCVDMNASMRFGTRNTFKSVQAARVAAWLGWQGISQHERISACLYGEVEKGIQYFPPQRTKQSFCQLLKQFTFSKPSEQAVPMHSAFEQLSRSVHTGSLLYVISDFMEINEEWLPRLKQKCEIVFIAVNDPSDASLFPVGYLGFSSKKEKAWINTDSLAGREAYTMQWEKNRERLSRLTARYQIPLIAFSTESDIVRELPAALEMMAKRKAYGSSA